MGNFKSINGTPWHIETIGMDEDDKRRHRSRCVYFESANIYCNKMKGKCTGSAHCKYYKEKAIWDNEEAVLDKAKEHPKTNADKRKLNEQSNQLSAFVGKKIEHTLYGEGKVISFNNGTVTIKFNNGVDRKFSIKNCTEKGLLKW